MVKKQFGSIMHVRIKYMMIGRCGYGMKMKTEKAMNLKLLKTEAKQSQNIPAVRILRRLALS